MNKLQKVFNDIIGDVEITDKILEYSHSNNRTRSLLFNLRKFPHLRVKLLDGTLDPEYFSKHMTHDEMLPVKRESKLESFVYDNRDGIERCSNCNSMRTECVELHTLEYTIIRVYCKDCGTTGKI